MKNILSENIARFRRSKGYTQEELAGKLNLSPQAVSKWENALSMPEGTKLSEIARLFQISLDELLPSAREYGEHHLSIYGLICGMAVMAISLLLFL